MGEDLGTITRRLSVDPAAADAQMALLDRLEPDRKAQVIARLRTVDAFMRSGRTAGDAQKAADDLGTGVRNLYRLIARMEKVGPVGGLIPGHRARSGGGVSADPADVLVDGWLRTFLRGTPAASRARAEGYLQGRLDARAEADPDAPVVEAPGPVALAARIDALRREGAMASGSAIGGRVLIDQVVLAPLAKGMRIHQVAGTFVLDRSTSTILGVGISALPDVHGDGLAFALNNMARRTPALAKAGLEVVPLSELEWIVPPGLVDVASLATVEARPAHGGAASAAPRLSVVADGERRHASRILPILGASLGRLRFLTRASLDPDPLLPPSDGDGREPRDGTDRIDDIHSALLGAADRWNSARLKVLARNGAEDADAAGRSASELVDAVRSILAPVFAAAEARLEPPPEDWNARFD